MAKPKLKSSRHRQIFYTTLNSSLGLIGIAGSENGLLRIVLQSAGESQFKNYIQKSFSSECLTNPPFFAPVVKQMNLYFAGKLRKFTCKLDLTQGTPFQQEVWRRLTAIPYGKTQSYRTMAKDIGRPRAFRAVGNANGKNPLPLIVPCHRVIRENGALGGYTGGLHLKRFLLNLENT